MRPKNIFLIRHGQSLSNASHRDGINKGAEIHRVMPDHKIPLTELGHIQALACGDELKLYRPPYGRSFAFYVSSYLRTRETAKNILTRFDQRDIYSYREDPRLREQEWWNLCNMEDRDLMKLIVERDEFGPFYYRFADGESGADIYDRCSGFLETLYRDFQKDDYPENVAIISHGFTIRILLMRWFHWTVEQFEDLRNPKNCQIIRLELDNVTYKYELKSHLLRKSNEQVK